MQLGNSSLAGLPQPVRGNHRPRESATIAVLAITPHQKDLDSLEVILRSPHYRVVAAPTLSDALGCVQKQVFSVVICDRDLPDGDWRALLERLGTVENSPRLIVCSRLADYRLWAEVLNLGGYDVLITPFDREEVLRVICQAAGTLWAGEA